MNYLPVIQRSFTFYAKWSVTEAIKIVFVIYKKTQLYIGKEKQTIQKILNMIIKNENREKLCLGNSW